jgi:subtilisin family serine protease
MNGCDNNLTVKEFTQKDCEENWAICVLIPDKKMYYDESKLVKVAVLDSGINEDILELNRPIEKKYNAINNSENIEHDFGHGTKVASIIASNLNKSLIGLNENVLLYDVQVLDENGFGNVENVVDGIKWGIEQEVDIINLSFGFSIDDINLHEAILKANEQGIILVASTGNSIGEFTDYPARYPEVLSISAVDSGLDLYPYAGLGKVDFVAPGVDVKVIDANGEIVLESGTSLATAYATSVIVNLLQFISDRLIEDSKRLDSEEKYGNGLIQLNR